MFPHLLLEAGASFCRSRRSLVQMERGRKSRLKIASFNINGINGRLDILLRWLNHA
jgi:hypothetical protein